MRRGFSSAVFHSISVIARPIAALLWCVAFAAALWVFWLFAVAILGDGR